MEICAPVEICGSYPGGHGEHSSPCGGHHGVRGVPGGATRYKVCFPSFIVLAYAVLSVRRRLG